MPSLESVRALEPSQFSFTGFEDMMEPLEKSLRRAQVRRGERTVSAIENGVFVPAMNRRAIEAGEFLYWGGIVDSQGQPIDAVHLRRKGTKIIGGLPSAVMDKPKRELDEEVVYLGWLVDHFGHFLLESLARTWFLKEVDPSVRVIFHRIGPPTVKGVIRRVLEAFGIAKERILFIDVPTRIRQIAAPEPLYEILHGAHERAGEPYREAAAGILGRDSVDISEQPVYLSRRLLPSDRREIVGEAELEVVLRENGFLIVHPETLTFEDQVRLFNRHTDIFTCEGSAAHNVLFANGSPRLHLLTAGIPLRDYFLVPTVAHASASFLNCLNEGGRRRIAAVSPLLLEMPLTLNYLEERGFLRTRPGAMLSPHMSKLQPRYDEAWFCRRLRTATRPGQALLAEEEAEAERLAASSWPLSWLLARYYASHDPARVTGLVDQFVVLIQAERNEGLQAHYREEIEKKASVIARACDPETTRRLTDALVSRFGIELSPHR